MHLLAAKPGGIDDGAAAVDLGQSPGDIVILSAADSDLQIIAAAHDDLTRDDLAHDDPAQDFPDLRLANLMNLSHDYAVDLYVDSVIQHAKLVVVRLLGGVNYWRYGVEQLVETCRRRGIKLALLPGDDQPDAELHGLSTLPVEQCHQLWQYCVHGGLSNTRQMLLFAASLIGEDDPDRADWRAPAPLLRAGLYWPDTQNLDLDQLRQAWQGDAVVAIVFYRALVQASNLAPIDALISALSVRGLNPLPIFVSSLKEPISADIVRQLFAGAAPDIIFNTTGFSVSRPNAARAASPLEEPGCPVLQVVLAGGTEEDWAAGSRGLSARDIAMNIALPEVDGRIITRAISFKSEARFHAATQLPVIAHQPVQDRIDFVCELAANWIALAATPPAERRLALVFANYPNRDGRLGNGVGLDSPASAFTILKALTKQGYQTGDLPADGQALIHRLAAGPTNDLSRPRQADEGIAFALSDYQDYFDRLPATVRQQVTARWGAAGDDPFIVAENFILPAFKLGNIIIGLQPARGYNIDPKSSYHDPDLVPPHGYLAFHAWLRLGEKIHAVVHVGKHGNLEWLPGKALALSEDCFPEVALGPLPHLYPFIVNDPGEGTQAKRRAQAVIIDHLTPPLTRAENYGPLAELELLVDEYYEAAGLDPRRINLLRQQILDATRDIGLDLDAGIGRDDDETTALAKLDNYLCDLKEMQIRDGLHIFGQSPCGRQRRDLLIALTRLPRNLGEGGDASLIRALAKDLGLSEGSGEEPDNAFDPLDCQFGDVWQGPKPAVLAGGVWRSFGDTVERLEELAARLLDGDTDADPNWQASNAVLREIEQRVGPTVDSCGEAEIAGLMAGLDGRAIAPGPSGAPTRGRLDVLPTGRNFYSVDTRTVPTPAAWQLGWRSAGLLLDEYRQNHGAWPRQMALSAWGTANMRTGGDDIAQALAFIGVQPRWEPASRRVIGFEILSLDLLDRPRVDITLRISGFFRDAFPAQIDLFDSAVRAIAALDEPDAMNPIAARVRADTARLRAQGHDPEEAERQAGARVFGSMPGAYGAGLQALIDEGGWRDDGDLARAYVAWGSFAYGGGQHGAPAAAQFRGLLATTQAVLHNQDNREHDLLDSDDYYQFEGGLAAAIRHLSGTQPAIYHNDHSRPERPQIRSLDDEIGRVVRARVVNPKWIAGVMRHGYKGAFEMAATVDYLFAFAATARVVRDHHFDAVYEAYLGDPTVREFLLANNPAALKEMADRLLEAMQRGLWRAKSNFAAADLRDLGSGKFNLEVQTTEKIAP